VKYNLVQDRRDRMYYLVNDEEEALIAGHRYGTLAEARKALSRIATRIPQKYIEELLLDGNESNQCLGRLLASEAWPAFELWLDSERVRTANDAIHVLDAIISFTAVVLAGVAKEHWPVGEPVVDNAIEKLVLRRLKRMMEAE
jgi:hypothetical protein